MSLYCTNFYNFLILNMFGDFTSSFYFQSGSLKNPQGTFNTGLRLAVKTISPKENLLSLKLGNEFAICVANSNSN